MAILEAPLASGGPITGWDLPDSLPPAGTFISVCLGVKDTFDLERPTFEDPSIIEKVNVCRFAFGLIGQDGIKYIVQTREMKISCHEKANLFQFLYQWLGHPPVIGTDTMDMVGRGAQLTIGHETSRKTGRTFPAIATIAPVMEANTELVPDAAVFDLPPINEPAPQQPAPQPAEPLSGQQAHASIPQRNPAPVQPQPQQQPQQTIFASNVVPQPDNRDQPPPF